jgi:hypothetical protein
MNETIKERIGTMIPILNERQRRLFLASEARAIGRGGITQISGITGVSRVTITLITDTVYRQIARSRQRAKTMLTETDNLNI